MTEPRRSWWRQKDLWRAAALVALLHAVLLGDAPLAFLQPQAPALAAVTSPHWVALVGDVRAAEPARSDRPATPGAAKLPQGGPAPHAPKPGAAPARHSAAASPAPTPTALAEAAVPALPAVPQGAAPPPLSAPSAPEAVQVAAAPTSSLPQTPLTPVAARVQTEVVSEAPPEAHEGSSPVTVAPPVYPARLPPDFAWRYTLRRGVLSGQADLVLQVKEGSYVLDLRGTALGLEILGLRSQGTITAHGLKPVRFVERRLGRDRLAANFDWPNARLTYSGPTTVRELWPGTQDRLSWMVQLGAVIDAQPERFRPGEVVQLTITTVRADVDTWAFQVAAAEMLERPGQPPLRTLHVTRQPLRPYDTQVDVWLDPQRHHLPVKARLATQPNGEALDLLLQE